MLHLRALRNTQIVVRVGHQQGMVLTTETGMHFVEGPKETEDGGSVPGEIVSVENEFVVNPEVWEVVKPSPDGKSYVVLPHPVAGVRYTTPRVPRVDAAIPVPEASLAAELTELREANATMQAQLAELSALLRTQTAGEGGGKGKKG